MVGVLHQCVHERLYLLLGKVASIDAFGRVDVPCKKGLNGRRPSFLAMETMCFSTIM